MGDHNGVFELIFAKPRLRHAGRYWLGADGKLPPERLQNASVIATSTGKTKGYLGFCMGAIFTNHCHNLPRSFSCTICKSKIENQFGSNGKNLVPSNLCIEKWGRRTVSNFCSSSKRSATESKRFKFS